MTERTSGRAVDQWRTRFEAALLPAGEDGRPRFRRKEHDLVSLLLASAAATPDHPCLTDGVTGETFTYASVERCVLALAGQLRRRGFQPGDRLALIDPASPASVMMLLATLAAGGVAVPLNERLHPSELTSLLASVRPRAIATSRSTVDFWPSPDLILIDPAVAVSEARHAPRASDPVAPSPGAWAFILHTGGTTGQPKSVVLSHDAVIQNLTFFRLGLGLDERDRALVAAPLFHVTGLMAQVLHMLEIGGESVLLPRFDARTFVDVAASTAATYSCVVPTMVRLLLQELGGGRGGETLRLLLYGGAPMDPATLSRFAERLPQVGLVNTYGATETSGSATFLPAELAAHHPTSVGFESPVVRLTLNGEESAPAPDGGFVERGIIAMSGVSTSPGYLVWDGDDPSVTPFPPGGWSSGDEGGRDADGLLHILGRIDDIVNKGGEKIHPEEIERYLLAHDAVVEAAVCGVPDAMYGQELLAAVVPRPGRTLSDDEVRAHLSQFVGRFKIPRYVEVVSELPRTAAGKINKREIASAHPAHHTR